MSVKRIFSIMLCLVMCATVLSVAVPATASILKVSSEGPISIINIGSQRSPGEELIASYVPTEADFAPYADNAQWLGQSFKVSGDYDITKGRTYWFFDKEVLYPFGYGLSYTTFDYQNLKIDKKKYYCKW